MYSFYHSNMAKALLYFFFSNGDPKFLHGSAHTEWQWRPFVTDRRLGPQQYVMKCDWVPFSEWCDNFFYVFQRHRTRRIHSVYHYWRGPLLFRNDSHSILCRGIVCGLGLKLCFILWRDRANCYRFVGGVQFCFPTQSVFMFRIGYVCVWDERE